MVEGSAGIEKRPPSNSEEGALEVGFFAQTFRPGSNVFAYEAVSTKAPIP
jgi:hypothetical protein